MLWETYSGIDGKGKRNMYFTGWSSLVALIIVDMY